jgi:hypothetical protein
MIIFGHSFAGFIEALLWVLAAFMVFAPVFIYGPLLESLYLPVESNFRIERVETGDNQYLYYNVYFTKVRSCDPIKGSMAWYGVDKNNVQERIYFEPPSKTTTDYVGDPSGPMGKNKTGYWRVDTYGKTYPSYKILIFNNCHPLWRTRTEVEIKAK